MFSWLARIALGCWRPVSRYARMSKDNKNNNDDLKEDSSSLRDSLLWCRDLEKHSYGDFSYAVVQTNEIIVKLRLAKMVAPMLLILSLIISFKI